MFNRRCVKTLLYILTPLFAVLFLIPFAVSGSSNNPEKPKSEICIRCHTMESEYEAWMHSGAHRRKMCVDCHLPNENKAVYYLWKSIDGLKDLLVYHSGRISEQIKISSHGETVLQNNCIRCHETTVMLMDQTRKCWSCHKRISHLHVGIRETI
jgi:cytochrome c nitrite reductase small subunit